MCGADRVAVNARKGGGTVVGGNSNCCQGLASMCVGV